MLSKLVLAVVVGVIVTLACVLVGDLLDALTVQLAITIGNWLKTYSAVLGILAALWYFFAGSTWFRRPQ